MAKSTFSGAGNCVDVNIRKGETGLVTVVVRDTKAQKHGPALTFNSEEWQAFIDGVKAGEFDLPTG